MKAAVVVVSLVVAALIPGGAAAQDIFKDAKLNVQKGDKTEQVDVVLRYEPTELVVANNDKSKPALKTIVYADVKGAEYSYAKTPRWKSGIFISPFFLFTSGKKHWLMVQSNNAEFAVLQLDKSNYRMVVAELEAKIGRKVDVSGDK